MTMVTQPTEIESESPQGSTGPESNKEAQEREEKENQYEEIVVENTRL
jgi:hypothetical protein